VFVRHGLDLARSTLCDWVGVVAQKLRPLHELLVQRVFLSHVVQTDDTTIPVQDPESGKTRTSRMWVYLGDKNHPATVYDYTPSRARHGPKAFLGEFEGYLQADAYGGYDAIFAKGKMIEVACWAHAQRKFYDARDSDTVRVHAMLGMIRELYAVEKQAKEFDDAARLAHWQAHAAKVCVTDYSCIVSNECYDAKVKRLTR
jgi:transposase